MALVIRAELLRPGLQLVDSPDQFNQLFTMHGTIMLLLFATPLFAGFANALMPLQIGAPDVSFPRLNMFAWLVTSSVGSLRRLASSPRRSLAFGWFAYAPLSDSAYSPVSAVTSGLRPRARWFRHHPRCGQLHHHDPHVRAPRA